MPCQCPNCNVCTKSNSHHNTIPQTTFDDKCIQQRQALRIRLAELEQEHAYNIQIIKGNIINQCELAIDRELRECELKYQNQIQLLNADLTALKIELNSANKKLEVFQGENQQLAADNEDLNQKIKQLQKKLEKQRQKFEEKLKEELEDQEQRLRKKHEKEINDLKKKYEYEQKLLENELNRAKDKLAQFENQYRQLLAELEKLRNALNDKGKDAQGWKNKFYDSEKEKLNQQKPQEEPQKEDQEAEKLLKDQVKNLKDKLQGKKDQIKQLKENPIIKTQTVIVEQPVQVQVEKIVEVIKYQPIECITRQRVGQVQPVIIQKHQHVEEIDEDTITKMKDYIKELEDLLRNRDDSIDDLQDSVARKSQEIDQLKRHINDLNNKIKEVEKSTEDQIRQLEDRMRNLKSDPINIKVDKDGNVHKR